MHYEMTVDHGITSSSGERCNLLTSQLQNRCRPEISQSILNPQYLNSSFISWSSTNVQSSAHSDTKSDTIGDNRSLHEQSNKIAMLEGNIKYSKVRVVFT